MKHRSLSATFGSWCVQLIYNPRRAAGERLPQSRAGSAPHLPQEQTSSELSLLLPGFIASWITVGAGCYALSHFITLSNFTSTLVFLLMGSGVISLGAQCFSQPWKRLCEASRWPLVLVLILLAISTRFNNVIPLDDTSESNALVAVFLCFITLLSVLLAGARSGGRIVPLSAPLVPGLSLFGLLCLISVDTEIQVCFLIFLASAIYLLCYCRFLRRIRPDLALGTASSTKPALLPGQREVLAWSKQSLLVTSFWSALFLTGGILLYLPVQKFLPVLVTPQLNRVRAAAQNSMLDYRGSSSVMELHGGSYALSDRQTLRITMHQGEPSGLWRGRTYEFYDRSHWEEGAPENQLWMMMHSHHRRLPWPMLNRFLARSLKAQPPILKPLEGNVRNVIERVEPLDESSNLIYSSGSIISRSRQVDEDTSESGVMGETFNMCDLPQGRTPYVVRSFVVEPNWGTLLASPGYERTMKEFPALLSATLELPHDPDLLSTLESLKQQMYAETRRPPQTPFAKVRTISNYLIQNCTYSLQSPVVPSARDAVDFFLTDSRQGACDMFASSMVLMLRK